MLCQSNAVVVHFKAGFGDFANCSPANFGRPHRFAANVMETR
jgi:hypothetical protein